MTAPFTQLFPDLVWPTSYILQDTYKTRGRKNVLINKGNSLDFIAHVVCCFMYRLLDVLQRDDECSFLGYWCKLPELYKTDLINGLSIIHLAVKHGKHFQRFHYFHTH